MNIITIIPARGGSKGIPRKNVRHIAGKPLIVHSIEQSMQSSLVIETFVSTDDDEIEAISAAAGATVIRRPAEISGDQATSESTLLHLIQVLSEIGKPEPDLVVFLQCTSPVRKPADIDNAIKTLIDRQADSVLSVSPSHRFLWTEEDGIPRAVNYDFLHRPRRQDMPPQYIENGSIYVFRSQGFLDSGNRLFGKVALHPMDEEAAVDIDTFIDFKLAELIMLERIGTSL